MQTFDIAIIGSGIACTNTLIELFTKLISGRPLQKPLHIIVIEKNQEFWKGIPYGSRSSVNALTITCVKDFIHQSEANCFFRWLKTNQEEWVRHYRLHGGATAHRWLENNLNSIVNEEWETTYIPRFIFGIYLQDKLLKLKKTVEENQSVKIELLQAEATDVNINAHSHYEVTYAKPGQPSGIIAAHKLVIATGSAPVKKAEEFYSNVKKVTYINDLYDPCADANIKKLQTTLAGTAIQQDRNILIIGSNASSIEFLYLLEGLPEIRKLINKTVVISPSGKLPYHISAEVLTEHPTHNLDKLKNAGKYTIHTLVEAAALDLKPAVQNGANVGYIATIISSTINLLQALDEDSKKTFFGIYGMQLSNMFRRSGPEYKAAANLLLELEEVSFLCGKFLNMAPVATGGLLNYLDCTTNTEKIFSTPFKVVINCSGSNNLDQSSSSLLYNLVDKQICRVNLSGKGFEVNEKFEAAPNLYVMGPLLGGNMNKRIHFWHLENASRLKYLAPYLAEELLSDNCL